MSNQKSPSHSVLSTFVPSVNGCGKSAVLGSGALNLNRKHSLTSYKNKQRRSSNMTNDLLSR